MLSKLSNMISLDRCPIEALNRPEGWEIFQTSGDLSIDRIKIAATASMDKDELGGYDLKTALKEHPDHLFVKVFAIKKDEVNDNADSFDGEELKKAANTFIGCPVFCNHANDDIEKARGKIVHAWYDDDKGGIFIISMVDKVAYPKLARGIEEGYIVGTSMGCQVHHSLCSICHTKAHVAEEYCDHIKNRKNKKFSGKAKCKYHESKCKPDDNCPVCGCEKGDEKEETLKEAHIYEHNKGLKFIEDSFVVNPACHDCLVDAILNVPEFTKKVASLSDKFHKVMANSAATARIVKTAGKAEVDILSKAMKGMEVVAKSMMDQKDQVSMEYVSDIIDALASLQTTVDELVEMGYAQIPSPPTLEDPEGVTTANAGVPQGQQAAMPQQPAQPAMPPKPTGAASSPVGDIGTVTKPSFASGKIKDFTKIATKIKKQIAAIEFNEKIAHSQYRLTKDDITIVANRDENKNLTMTAFYGDMAVITKDTPAGTHLSERFEKNSDEVANELILEVKASIALPTTKEPENTMSKIEKTAAGQGITPESQQVTTEKQLNDAKLDLHPRTEKAPEGITESKEQLGASKEPVNDTSTKSPQVRDGEYAVVTTEGQFEDMGETPIARWDSAPDVILEKQWTDFARAVGSELKTDQAEHTTEGQIRDLLSHHRWTEPKVTTENQLKDDDNWLTDDNKPLSKGAYANYTKALVKAAMEAISDAIASYKRTPAEIMKAAKFISKDSSSLQKAAFLTLVNGHPKHKQSRKVEVARSSYFGKTASDISPVDALIACMGDNCSNLKTDDLVEAVRFIATDKARMARAESQAQVKLAKKIEIPEEDIVDKFAAFDNAFKTLTADEKPVEKIAANEDGLIEVTSTIDEIGDISDEASFIVSAEKFAKKQANASEDTVLFQVSVDKAANAVVTTLKLASKLTAEEKEASVKQAQMMGGEMGGGVGGGMPGGAGGGATMPQPPAGGDPGAAGAPPVESLQGAPGEEPGMDEGGDKEAMPPGSICPVCGSEDVDIVEGKGKCNNCNSQFVFKVQVEVTRWTGVNDKNSDDQGAAGPEGDAGLGGLGGEGEGAGFPMPETGAGAGEGAPNIPVAAMTRLTPDIVKKVASKLGSVSPLTGSTNTFELGNGKYLCMDTGSTYELVTVADKKEPKAVWAEWRWTPRIAGTECSSCKRTKAAWNAALKSAGLTSEQFEVLSFEKKANTILDMDAKGLFKTVKTASKNSSVVAEFKKAFPTLGKFPIESCREKLARRYGDEAVAISGPCKGEKIYDCVCSQLKNAGVYSDGIAIKVAESWKDRDGCLQCIEDFTRFGYDLEKSASICNHMKVRYASPEDMFAEELGDNNPDPTQPPTGGPGGAPHNAPADDFGGEDPFAGGDDLAGGEPGAEPVGELGGELGGDPAGGIDVEINPEEGIDVQVDGEEVADPFGGGVPPLGGGDEGVHGEVTIKVPLATLDALEQAIDKAHGNDPAGEAHHDIPAGDLGKEVEVEIPGEAADGLEQPIEDALDKEVGSGEPEGSSEGDPSAEAPKPEGSTEPSFESGEGEKEPSNEVEGNSDKEPAMEEKPEADHFANVMRKGKRVGQIDMDLSALAKLLSKKAGESEPKLERAQDAAGKIQDKGTLGNEDKFDPKKPSVPRGDAKIGNEKKDADRQPNDKPLPKVPSGDANMGHEKEQGYTSDGTSMTGGDKGQGKTETANAKATKVAKGEPNDAGEKVKGEGKKVGPAKPVSEEVPFEFSNNKDHPNTPENMKRVPFEASDEKEVKNVPEKNEGAFIGDEKSSIGDVPKANDKFAPNIPVGGGSNSKYDKNEKNKPELETAIKGTRIAESDEKSKQSQVDEATRIAGRMIEEKIIDASQLMKKIAELSSYKVEQLKDIEKQLFKSAKKGLAEGSDGIERSPVIISENSSQRSSDLKEKLSSLFSLDRKNKMAAEQTDADLRAAYDRR